MEMAIAVTLVIFIIMERTMMTLVINQTIKSNIYHLQKHEPKFVSSLILP